jgi:histidine phosphotransfer protein HptB
MNITAGVLTLSNTADELFNQEFALRQFSGNRTLLISMLSKFIAQYAYYPEKLDELLAQQAQIELVRYVHTIKGISGNLGLEGLYQASRSFETALNQEQFASERHTFITSLSLTLQHLQEYVDAETVNSAQTVTPPVLKSKTTPSPDKKEETKLAKQQLTSALSQQQFISSSKLLDYLQRIDLSPSDSEAVHKAINELDYATAIRYLK